MDETKFCRDCQFCQIGWPEEGEDYCVLKEEYIKKGNTAEENDCDKWEEVE